MSAAAVPNFDDFAKKQPVGSIPAFDDFEPKGGPSLTPGTPGSGAAGRFASSFASAVNPIPGIRQMATEASDPKIGLGATLGRHLIDPQVEQYGKAKEAAQGTGEFEHMPITGRMSSVFGHSLAGALPLVGPAAANAGEQVGSGDVAGGLGSGAGTIASVASPDVIRGVGKGLMRGAEPIAENASGIAYVDRAFGKNGEGGRMTPGRFALDYTRGVRPGTVSRQAQDALSGINNRLEGIVGNSKSDYRLQPARDVVGGEISKAGERNSKITPGKLQPMADFLGGEPTDNFSGATEYPQGAHTPITVQTSNSPILGVNGQPLPGPSKVVASGPTPSPVVAETQTPITGLGMKRQLNDDYIRNWNPTADTKGQLGVARKTSRAMADELHRAVPQSAPLDEAASAGIPVAERSDIKALRAGPIQNGINRFGAHTGALAGALYGAHEAGLPGAIAGIAVPEMLASPTVQMTGARGVDLIGKGMNNRFVSGPTAPLSSPTAMPIGRGIQSAPLIKRRPALGQ